MICCFCGCGQEGTPIYKLIKINFSLFINNTKTALLYCFIRYLYGGGCVCVLRCHYYNS